jgi:hypothetical protein
MHLQRLEAPSRTGEHEISEDGKAMRYIEVTPFEVHLTPACIARGRPHPDARTTPAAGRRRTMTGTRCRLRHDRRLLSWRPSSSGGSSRWRAPPCRATAVTPQAEGAEDWPRRIGSCSRGSGERGDRLSELRGSVNRIERMLKEVG